MKRNLTFENNYERMARARTMKHEENGVRYGGKTLLWSSKSENDDEKHHHELLRHSGMTIRKVEPTMKKRI